jgi:hypothetical protein
VLLQRPYRFAEWVEVRLHRPDVPEQLLPASSSPAVRRIRADQRESGRLAVGGRRTEQRARPPMTGALR